MGQRANLILVEGREYRLFYSHWCANTLASDLFWGPEHAVDFIRIQRVLENSDWLDNVWAEGGAVVDLDRKHLLLFGGDDVGYNVPLRRIYLKLLAQVWTGWTVRWAHEGIADLADYVGYPRDLVLAKGKEDSADGTLIHPEQKDWTDLVASVRFGDGSLRLYPLAGGLPSYLTSGSKLVESFRASDGLPRLALAEWTTEFPSGGFHIDISERRLEFWTASDAADLGNRAARAWPGWQTQWHHDHYETHLERTGACLSFPLPARDSLLSSCREMLLQESSTSGVATIKELTDRERALGKDVQVNSWALRDDRLELSKERRSSILNDAMSHLQHDDDVA